jgi:hypothetical protein
MKYEIRMGVVGDGIYISIIVPRGYHDKEYYFRILAMLNGSL